MYSKTEALRLAVDAAVTVLRVDQIIMYVSESLYMCVCYIVYVSFKSAPVLALLRLTSLLGQSRLVDQRRLPWVVATKIFLHF